MSQVTVSHMIQLACSDWIRRDKYLQEPGPNEIYTLAISRFDVSGEFLSHDSLACSDWIRRE